ncbi:ExeA family protein [Sulfuricystis multivorans]|uniref:ExeA family protein n=1 Tax=Sulfuricystis multivorans TaxID=2211108 RepID=UPI000F8427E4|nr:AAA family ATPase [Sulfuricystis multivorans]
MYLEHYGLSEPPFRITPHTDFFFAGANRGATLEALLYAISHDEGIVKISGEVGSGKTMLCRVLMERLPASVVVIYLANPSLSREDILYALADELGIPPLDNCRPATVMRALQEKLVALYAEGKQVVVLIDEAHAMPVETLEEIRLLSNLESNRHKLLQLVLFGQPELDATLSRPDMRQLRERITHNFRLEPLVQTDIAEYLDFRMRAAGYRGPSVFTPEAIGRIARVSAGLTRRINILADKALLASFANGSHQVGSREIEAAIRDAEFSELPKSSRRPRASHALSWASGGAVVVLFALAVWQYLFRPTEPSVTPQTNATSPDPSQMRLPATPVESGIPGEAVSTTPLLDKLLEESRPWLQSVASDRWFIQLFTAIDANDPTQVESFLANIRNAGLEMGQVRVYRLTSGDKPRYGILYGDYVSRQEAVNVLNTLPSEVKRYRPYPRQALRLKLEGKTMNKD